MSADTAHQLVQFDWRLVTTVGCSSASVIPRTEPNGMPLLQLMMDTATLSQIAGKDEGANTFTKFPSSPELVTGQRAADTTSMWELNVVEVEEVIARLQNALAIADKACPPAGSS